MLPLFALLVFFSIKWDVPSSSNKRIIWVNIAIDTDWHGVKQVLGQMYIQARINQCH